MITFLKTILIVLLVYFGFKFLARLLAPYLMRYIARKAGQRFESTFKNMTRPQNQNTEPGKVTIDKVPKKSASSNSKVGDYVDFEEVE